MRFCNGMTYTVKSGDTLYAISRQYQVPLPLLLRANPEADVYNLQVGEKICIPVQQGSAPCCRYPRGNVWNAATEQRQTNDMTEENRAMPEETDGMVQEGMAVQNHAENMHREDTDARGENRSEENVSDVREQNLENIHKPDWRRTVSQPGDTLAVLAGAEEGMTAEETMQRLHAFIEKNGADRIILLPGVAYASPVAGRR